jgi:hypothetical protein
LSALSRHVSTCISQIGIEPPHTAITIYAGISTL